MLTSIDPSAVLCEAGYSLPNTATEAVTVSFPQVDVPEMKIETTVRHVWCNHDLLQSVKRRKDRLADPKLALQLIASNPFEEIEITPFLTRASIKLANIDAVHHLGGSVFTFDQRQSEIPITFAGLAEGPGGFIQYLLWRYPQAKGYGITLTTKADPKLNWSNVLDYTRFEPWFGDDNSGNLIEHGEEFAQYVRRATNGVDLVVADGGIDVVGRENEQEMLSARLLLTEAAVGIYLLKQEGDLVLKVFDCVLPISANMLFILAQCFESVALFKPVSSRPANSERYFIGKQRRKTVGPYIKLLFEVLRAWKSDLTSFFDLPYDSAFSEWLRRENDYALHRQAYYLDVGLGENVNDTTYDVHRFPIIWNIPSRGAEL